MPAVSLVVIVYSNYSLYILEQICKGAQRAPSGLRHGITSWAACRVEARARTAHSPEFDR